jgi:hypothetical protein
VADLKYNDEWLIPLQQGYSTSSGYSAQLSGGYPASGLRRQAVTVSASYRLKDAAMIAWWWQFYEANRGQQIGAILDTAGYPNEHSVRIVEPPQFQEYAGHTAVVTIQWVCNPAQAVVTQYVTSWPYPALEIEALSGSASMREGGKVFGALGAGAESISLGAALLPGGEVRNINRDMIVSPESVTGNGCELLNVTLVQTLFPEVHVDYDSGFESVTGNGCEISNITLVQTLFLVDYDSGHESVTGNGCELLSITLT